jgi:hypothetical protein
MSRQWEEEQNGDTPVQGERGVGGVGRRQDVGPAGAAIWNASLSDNRLETPPQRASSAVFVKSGASDQPADCCKSMHTRVGQLTLKKDFLRRRVTNAGLMSASHNHLLPG